MSLRCMFNLLRPQVTTSLSVRLQHAEKDIVPYDGFAKAAVKNKKTYIQMINMYIDNDKRRRGHVEFIYAAMKYLEEFGVHKDLEVYKTLLEVLPKGRFIPTNIYQAEFMHFPKQQQCAVDLLEKMEDNGVIPDFDMQDILMTVFGKRGIPLRKFWRMMYWMPKFRNLSPWYLPHNLPNEAMELAQMAIQRITSVDIDTKITVFQTDDVEAAIDKTWIISAQSPAQISLLATEALKRKEIAEKKLEKQKLEKENKKIHESKNEKLEDRNVETNTNNRINNPEEIEPRDSSDDVEPLTVRGPYMVHLRDQLVSYFILLGPVINRPVEFVDSDDIINLKVPGPFGFSSPPALKPSIHEQDDGTILAICATGSSSRDSLLSWIRLLEKNGNPGLGNIGVVFTLIGPSSDLVIQSTEPATME